MHVHLRLWAAVAVAPTAPRYVLYLSIVVAVA